jgi:hypothetical protein
MGGVPTNYLGQALAPKVVLFFLSLFMNETQGEKEPDRVVRGLMAAGEAGIKDL